MAIDIFNVPTLSPKNSISWNSCYSRKYIRVHVHECFLLPIVKVTPLMSTSKGMAT